ncbi:MAG: hypothetical protein PHQ11_10705 [Paludibacter sp.]|nr:hypothetical protein [Paludibacter sp.]
MKKCIFSFVITVLISSMAFAQNLPLPNELLTPSVVEVNREPMRAHAFAYESLPLAEEFVQEKSANFLSLDGSWRFHFVTDPRTRPQDFYKTSFNDRTDGWVDFSVPANWEVNGFAYPIYINQFYDFVGREKSAETLNPPFDIPVDHNPVGSYLVNTSAGIKVKRKNIPLKHPVPKVIE